MYRPIIRSSFQGLCNLDCSKEFSKGIWKVLGEISECNPLVIVWDKEESIPCHNAHDGGEGGSGTVSHDGDVIPVDAQVFAIVPHILQGMVAVLDSSGVAGGVCQAVVDKENLAVYITCISHCQGVHIGISSYDETTAGIVNQAGGMVRNGFWRIKNGIHGFAIVAGNG